MEPSIPDPQFVYPLRSTWPYLTSTLAPILDFSHCPISCQGCLQLFLRA